MFASRVEKGFYFYPGHWPLGNSAINRTSAAATGLIYRTGSDDENKNGNSRLRRVVHVNSDEDHVPPASYCRSCR